VAISGIFFRRKKALQTAFTWKPAGPEPLRRRAKWPLAVNPIRPLSHLSRGASLEDEGVQHFKGSVASKPMRMPKWKLRWFSGSERDRALPDSEVTPDSLDHVQAIRIHHRNPVEASLRPLLQLIEPSFMPVSPDSDVAVVQPKRASHGAV